MAARSEFLFLVASVFMFEVDSSRMDGFLIDF